MQKIVGLFFLIFFISFVLKAQIEKDSTLGKWGTHTVWLKDVNSNEYARLDTSLNNIHQFDVKLRKDDFFQDLGAIGSSYRSLNFISERSIFKEMNQDVFENYSFAKERKFYNTYGPYSRVEYDFRGKDNTFIDGIYTRNVNENWNLGFQFRRLRYAKLYANTEPVELINSTALRFFTSYVSKNKKYNALADYHSINHNQVELGGIDLDGNSIRNGYFEWYNLNANLSGNSRFETRNYFLRQSYKIDSSGKIAIFHQFDRKRELHKYIDQNIEAATINYYPAILNDSTKTFSFWELNSFKNQLGLLGTVNKIDYQASIHLRSYRYEIENEKNNYKEEIALQIIANYRLNDSSKASLNLQQSQTGAFDYAFKFNNKLIQAQLYSQNSLPYLMNERFYSNHYEWNNTNLTNTQNVGFNLFFKGIEKLKIGFDYKIITNYMYFDNLMNVQQENKAISVLTPEVNYLLEGTKLAFKTRIKYHIFTGNKVLGLPNFNSVSKLYYKANLIKNSLKTNFGVELRTYSDYYSYGYMPTTHTFYYQNNVKAYSFPNMVGFINFEIKNATLFFRGNNLLEYVGGWNFETPNYPQKPIGFVFGVNWKFFD